MMTQKAVPFIILMFFCSIIVIIPKSFCNNVNPTIEIFHDGNFYPDDAPIQRNGNIYTLTKDIEVVSDGISIAKDNIVIDGAGYTITGRGIKTGIIIGAYTPPNAGRQNVTIENLNVINFECGIRLDNSSNNMISNCTLVRNPRGIEIGFYSNCNQIIGNQITNFSVGILVNDGSNGNNIENNVLDGRGTEGNQGMVIYPSQNQTINQNNISICSVHLYGDSFNVANNHFVYSSVQLLGNFHTLRYNQFVNCSLYVDDLKYSLGLNDIDTSNTVNGKPIYYLVDKKDNAISSNAGQIILIRCDNITIQNVQIAHNTEKAIYLVKTNNSLITQNTISSNNLGIHLLDSENNTIAYNIISENEVGIKVTDSRFNQIFKNNFTYNNGFAMEFLEAQGNNTLYHNNFIGNNEESTNLQVSMPGYGPTNIANSNFWSKDGEGNFWSDYTTRYSNATQINGTGIGDTPFFINENNIDYYPLLESIIIPEFPSLIVLPIAMIVILIVTALRRRDARATNSCPASKRVIATLTMKKLKKIYLVSLLITTTLILSSATVHAFEVTAAITLENPGGYYGIAYDSGKSEIFLTNADFDLVSVISDSTNAVVANIPVGSQPVGIAYDSAKGELFVANYASDSISVIADGTNTVVANIPVGSQPFAVVYDSGKGEIFVTNYNASSVSVISDSTNTVVANIPVGSQPCDLAYDSGKGEIFVGHAGCNQVLVISDSTNAVVANVTMEDQPVSLAYDSGKGEIFVANYNSSSVSVISDSTNLIVATVNVGANPIGLAYDSGNGQIFVANYNSNSVSVISDSTNTVIENVTLENQPQGICYDSGKGEIFVTYSESNRVSVISDSSLQLPSPSIPDYPLPLTVTALMVVCVGLLVYFKKRRE